jgi:hypothetical protein
MATTPRFKSFLAATALLLSACAFSQQAQTPQIDVVVDVSGGHPTYDQAKLLTDISRKAKDTAIAEYPMTLKLIGAEGHPQPKVVTILFTYDYKGVAETSGDHMQVSAAYSLRHPDDIPGVIVHEMTHVAQNYRRGHTPGWLVEGIADFVRWFNYEPLSKRPHPNPQKAEARGSYQTTAAFLYWVVNKYDRDLVKQLNEALYQGVYTEDIWKKLTGKSLDDLDAEWKGTLQA